MIAPPPKHRNHSMNDHTAAKRTAALRRSKHYLRTVSATLIVLSHCAPAWSGSSQRLPPDENYPHNLHLRLARIETLLENQLPSPYRDNTDDPALRSGAVPPTLPSTSTGDMNRAYPLDAYTH